MMYAETAQSERLYSRVAPTYETVFERAILAEGRLTAMVRRYMDGKRVLDLACGNGRWLARFDPSDYTGLDLNEKMLAEARRRYPGSTFVCADMTGLPFADAAFEGVVSLFGAMGHLPRQGQQKMIREAHRVLRADGIAIFTNGNVWSPFNVPLVLKGHRVRIEGIRVRVHSASPSGFRRSLEQGGFEVLEVSSYDYSYLPIMPLKFGACLAGRDYRGIYSGLMDVLENCCYVPMLRWFGKQLVAVCRRPGPTEKNVESGMG
jgi:SAM-dependent methyltransferase